MLQTELYPHRIEGHVRAVERGEYPHDHMLTWLVRFLRSVGAGEQYIRRQDGTVASIVLNRSQLVIVQAMMDQAAAGRPIRIRDLKHRKGGHSTFYQLLFKFLCENIPNRRAKTIAHRDESTKEIFDIARLAAERSPYRSPTVPETRIVWPDIRSEFSCTTAGGTSPGAGGTPSYVLFSERPKWEPLSKKKMTYVDVVNSVPYLPETILVDESTARGREEFFADWEKGCDPADVWTSLFFPWFIDERLSIEAPSNFAPTDDERRLCGHAHSCGIEITNGMLAWRRMKIAEIGEDAFRQDYPSTPEEAVQGTKGLILPGIRQCVIDEFPFEPARTDSHQRVGGIDHGYHDPCVIGSGFYVDRVLYLAQVWRQCESLAAEQLDGLLPSHRYYCDPAGLSDRMAIQREADKARMGCHFSAAPRKKNPAEDCETVELKQLVLLANQGRLKIHRACIKQLSLECDNLAWNEVTGKPDMTRSDACGHYDTIMMLKYTVMGCIAGDLLKLKPVEKRVPRSAEWAAY